MPRSTATGPAEQKKYTGGPRRTCATLVSRYASRSAWPTARGCTTFDLNTAEQYQRKTILNHVHTGSMELYKQQKTVAKWDFHIYNV